MILNRAADDKRMDSFPFDSFQNHKLYIKAQVSRKVTKFFLKAYLKLLYFDVYLILFDLVLIMLSSYYYRVQSLF